MANGSEKVPGAEWHLIGHLQSNKAAKAAELFDAVDSIDSVRITREAECVRGKRGQDTIRPDRSQCGW